MKKYVRCIRGGAFVFHRHDGDIGPLVEDKIYEVVREERYHLHIIGAGMDYGWDITRFVPVVGCPCGISACVKHRGNKS
jgi:hypothetical protein